MTDPDSKIIPFGKYRGRLIEDLLIDDPGYLQWLVGQDWFRAKFNILHQVIINRGAEPEETPDHNAMQVKFLDDEFCLRFLNSVEANYAADVCSMYNRIRAANLKLVELKFMEQKLAAPKNADETLADDLKRIEGMTQWYRQPARKNDPNPYPYHHPDPEVYQARETKRAKQTHETERAHQGTRLEVPLRGTKPHALETRAADRKR